MPRAVAERLQAMVRRPTQGRGVRHASSPWVWGTSGAPRALSAVGVVAVGGLIQAGQTLTRTTPAEPPLWILYGFATLLVVASEFSLGGAEGLPRATPEMPEEHERTLAGS